MKKLDFISITLTFISYCLFRLELKGYDANNIFFLSTSLFIAYAGYRMSHQYKGIWRLIITYFYTFFACISGLFLWYWVILNDPAIWVYNSLLIATPVSFLINYIKCSKNGNIAKRKYSRGSH